MLARVGIKSVCANGQRPLPLYFIRRVATKIEMSSVIECGNRLSKHVEYGDTPRGEQHCFTLRQSRELVKHLHRIGYLTEPAAKIRQDEDELSWANKSRWISGRQVSRAIPLRKAAARASAPEW